MFILRSGLIATSGTGTAVSTESRMRSGVTLSARAW